MPTEGRALLRLDSNSAGVVERVQVLDVSSGYAEWQEVAAQIAASARSKPPIRLPTGAHGASITIEVTSAMRTNDGGTPSHSTVGKIVGAITHPLDTAVAAASHEPLVHVVKARVVDVEYL